MHYKVSLKGKSLLRLSDITDEEMLYLISLASELKKKKKEGIRGNLLDRKNVAMIFEKMSTRTRCATSVAVFDEGGNAQYLSSNEIHLGKKESVEDTAKVLGRMFDGILFRGYKQETVEVLHKYSGVTVWNGLTDECHPTQALADLLTVKEHFGSFEGLKYVYIGDGRNNVANSLMMACAKAGMDFVNCTPPELMPSELWLDEAGAVASRNKSSIKVEHNPAEAVKGANIISTDVWVSMGEEDKFDERINLLQPYQVNMNLVESTGNKNDLIFLHCLPAYHDANTNVSKEIGEMEVTDEVFKSDISKVFDEAENRMHTIKAMIVATLG